MLNKIKMLPIMLQYAIMNFVHDLKEDENGMSDAVTTILLVLVGVLAVAMIWGFMGDWIGELWAQITGKAATIQ